MKHFTMAKESMQGGGAQMLTLCFLLHSTTGAGLFYKMQTSFGYFTGAGYNGQQFPVVIGETGSFYTAVSSQST